VSDFTTVSLYAFVMALKEPNMAPLPRAVLGIIASGRGNSVSRETIINSLWGEDWRRGEKFVLSRFDRQPKDPDVALRITIMHLRKMGYNIKARYGFGYSLKPDRT